MNKNIILLGIVILSLSGCSLKEKKVPLDDVGMVGIMAFDYIDEEELKLTVAIPQSSPDAEKDTQIFSVSTDLISKGIVDIEALSDKKIILNQLRVVLFNEEFAHKGNVEKAIQHLYRNSEVGNKVLIAVVKDNGEEMLKEEYPDKPNINFYLNDLLQPSINTAFNPNTNIHDFVYTQTNPVFDSIVPLLEKKDAKIEIEGIAIFKGKSMVLSLPKYEALIIQALQGRKKLAPLALTLDEKGKNERLQLDLISNKVKMRSNKSFKNPKLTIHMKIRGTLVEYKGEREQGLKTPESLTKLEKDINEQIEIDVKKFLEELMELQVDPIGLTENFRMYYKGKWSEENKLEILNKLQLDIQVETNIISTGTLK
ncbi:Ger(x)C family spore germination protein [Bacillus sp. FJAT-22090]|uniref:Ger(x)C family spore germination protein n=1 Tax=Bacillus sp. FJAT-22090 TaxID=1581038 RepID=UPI0011AB0F03|nr:Ger(x)C family spore germination protein [Bacillus sp. FJAT-22090]